MSGILSSKSKVLRAKKLIRLWSYDWRASVNIFDRIL